jgi:hypothetical protein
MAMSTTKKYPTISACGLDCVLCPRYYTEGKSRCGGCGSEYSPAVIGCKVFRCCVKEKGLGICAECSDYPCPKFEGIDAADSFITHQKMATNLRSIKEFGIETFLDEQEDRRSLLVGMLDEYNDGRSKSFFCVATTLLPIETLKASMEDAKRRAIEDSIEEEDKKGKAMILKSSLNEAAMKKNVDLELRKARSKKST